jgi:hypothetical protein
MHQVSRRLSQTRHLITDRWGEHSRRPVESLVQGFQQIDVKPVERNSIAWRAALPAG